MKTTPRKRKIRPARLKQLGSIQSRATPENLTTERFREALEFIRACAEVGAWRLEQGMLTEDAGFYLAEIASELAHIVGGLIKQGDVMLARRLPPVVEMLQQAMRAYGSTITGRITQRHSIEQLLKKHCARELLAMLSALHPDWEKFLPVYEQPEKPAEFRSAEKRRIQQLPENELHALLTTQLRWLVQKTGKPKRVEEWRKHPLAAIIENTAAARELESNNINLFVEHLFRGWLWSGPGSTFATCDWHGKPDLPSRADAHAWMQIVIPFLRRVTKDDALKLGVFKHLLAARKPVFAGERLANDKPGYIWNQVENRIRKAWRVMAKRAAKRNLEKTA